MITIRPGHERGRTRLEWLDSYHTFSFDRYYDPAHMGFGHLRVINEDRVAPGRGFGTHPHRDMEILTYVLSGALEHQDSLGSGSVIRPGEVQRMSAGTGIAHSEYNPSSSEPVHLLQIWILPGRRGLPPGYEQRNFSVEEMRGRLCLVAAKDGRDGALTIHQSADLLVARLNAGDEARHEMPAGRKAWLQVAKGTVTLNGQALQAGDGAAVVEERVLRIASQADSEVLLFDLAG